MTLVGGEPTFRPVVIKLFAQEFPNRLCVVSNGTHPLEKIKGLYYYWISIDGTREIHDKIRGKGSYDSTRKNILEYIEKNGNKAWKDVWISMTINTVNYKTVRDVVQEWYDYTNKIAFQFHTPFAKGDLLWLPFGPERSRLVDDIIQMRDMYDEGYVINPKKQLELMKKNWGGKGTTPIDCPTWTIIAIDHMGREKRPCCIGSAESDSIKPICEECGLGCYSIFVSNGLKG